MAADHEPILSLVATHRWVGGPTLPPLYALREDSILGAMEERGETTGQLEILDRRTGTWNFWRLP